VIAGGDDLRRAVAVEVPQQHGLIRLRGVMHRRLKAGPVNALRDDDRQHVQR
jgi:hypothetical protein